jgi:hypothetical protein
MSVRWPKVDRALHAAWKRLYEAAVRHKPTEVLFRRHHDYYPSERQQMEISAPDGLQLFPSENQFSVVLELHAPSSEGAEQKPAEAFRIVQPGGSADLWSSPQSNDQELPPRS